MKNDKLSEMLKESAVKNIMVTDQEVTRYAELLRGTNPEWQRQYAEQVQQGVQEIAESGKIGSYNDFLRITRYIGLRTLQSRVSEMMIDPDPLKDDPKIEAMRRNIEAGLGQIQKQIDMHNKKLRSPFGKYRDYVLSGTAALWGFWVGAAVMLLYLTH